MWRRISSTFALTLLAALPVSASPPVAGSATVPFLLAADDSGVVTASLHAGPGFPYHYQCEFSYRTRSEGAAAAPVDNTVAAAAREALATLLHQCPSLKDAASGFEYRLCIGESVVQTSGTIGTFSLGKFDEAATAKLPAHLQQYSGGDRCGEPQRSTRVIYYCGPTFTVLSAEEPSMCSYELKVSHPDLCQCAAFPRMPMGGGLAQLHGGGGAGGGDSAPRVHVLPPAVAFRLRALRAAVTGELIDSAQAAAAAGGLSAEDVPGFGGRSIGQDDSMRSTRRWTGLASDDGAVAAASGAAPQLQSWVLEMHYTWPSDAAVSEHGAGERHGSLDDGMGTHITCTAYSTDDLRKGDGRDRPGAAGGRIAGFSMTTYLVPHANSNVEVAVDTAQVASSARIDHVTAKGPNRHELRIADASAAADQPGVQLRRVPAARCDTVPAFHEGSSEVPRDVSRICLGGIASTSSSTQDGPGFTESIEHTSISVSHA
jgi:hypothetical protein